MPGQPKKRAKQQAFRKQSEIQKFRSRARSILWNYSPAAYKAWEQEIEKLLEQHEDWSRDEALVLACKNYKQLAELFKVYDVSIYDKFPDLHPNIKRSAPVQVEDDNCRPIPVCENLNMSHREQLRWALDAAGQYAAAGIEPESCPCWGAYYLYLQAQDNPKEFMTKLASSEAKVDQQAEFADSIRSSSRKSVTEIDEILTMIDEQVRGESDVERCSGEDSSGRVPEMPDAGS